VPCGQVVGLVHDIPTVKELAESIVSEATAIYEQLCKTIGKKR
jgi:NAD(P)H-dependent flavin oxidoreductase YrpB (nitropropane dioxygenase family)